MKTQEEIFIKMVLDAWYTQIKYADDLFKVLPDQQLLNEVAPGKNRGIYLLGHLTAVHDKMLSLLGLGNPLYPHLYGIFVERSDKVSSDGPGPNELRQYWKEVNSNLTSNFSKLSPAEWFQKHTAVFEDDFAKEPHRNKLNIIVNRTNHLANHLGQLLLLKSKTQ